MISRIYQNIPLAINQTVQLEEKASHHLSRVLRVSIGDSITVFNGEGGEYTAIIKQINKKNVVIETIQFIDRDVESNLKIHLAQGIARGEKMDFVIQKAVELGVTHITPLITERCNVHLSNEREVKRLKHWQSVVISACEQSGRNRLPTIDAPLDFATWINEIKPENGFVLTPHHQTQLKATSIPSATLLIGPEGGLSEQEIAKALQHGWQTLHLGPRILRTETATIAAITVLQFQYGDLT